VGFIAGQGAAGDIPAAGSIGRRGARQAAACVRAGKKTRGDFSENPPGFLEFPWKLKTGGILMIFGVF
jgi:hypothetical protein